MSDVLDKIVANKQREVALRKSNFPVSHIEKGLSKSTKSLFEAMSNERSDFIFECKKASPSKGLIRENFDLTEILKSYSQHASAISVLTDNKYFKGSFAHLKQVTETVKQPVLCKDFFIDTYQVVEARYYGADAILLMLSVLNDQQYIELARKASEFNLDVLTEVHDKLEMKRALELDAKIIGINNRNLKDLSIDLKTTTQLINSLNVQEKLGRVFISESGINNNQQVREIAPYVNGFLVGSSIMEKENINQQCKLLIYGRNKICGITEPTIAITASQAGAVYGGLIFYHKSKRNVSVEQALLITQESELEYVGVFVNHPLVDLVEIARKVGLSVVQLHGSEDLQYIEQLKHELPHIEIWKAIAVSGDLSDQQRIQLSNKNIDRFLLDSSYNGSFGGTGEAFAWHELQNINYSNFMLAGGLDISNIEEAIALKTYGLDINSGVEISPGVKSIKKISDLFGALHA